MTDAELNESYVIPSVFHPDLAARVAAAVREAAVRELAPVDG